MIEIPGVVQRDRPGSMFASETNCCIHELFERQVAAHPDNTAVVFDGEAISYSELNRQAGRVARRLEGIGIGPNVLVGLYVQRRPEMIVGVLAILKAGGAYVPLDAAYPIARLRAMLTRAPLAAILTTADLSDKLPGVDMPAILCLDEDSSNDDVAQTVPTETAPGPDDLAYAVFTSGSSGHAKLAGVLHRGWTNLLHWFLAEFVIDARDRVLLMSSFSFDITQRSIAMPLVAGGELHLLTPGPYDPAATRKTVEQQAITLVNCAPSAFYPLVEQSSAHWDALRSLRVVFLGGEAISASRLQAWATSPSCTTEVANVYGVAECADVSTFYRLRDYGRYVEAGVPIGEPISNSSVYLLDEESAPVAPGQRGEICIGGAGVGAGYVNDQALTRARFVSDPFATESGTRLYRTGDLATLHPDGTLELIGRLDSQVKLHGNRVDLGDIESTLARHHGVREAATVAKAYRSDDVRVVAYIVASDGNTVEADLVADLRNFAGEALPDYMVPTWLVLLTRLPLNPNGKVDRLALAERDLPAQARTSSLTLQSADEKRIAELFAELIGVGDIRVDTNFFHCGGNSYLATILLDELGNALDVELSIFDLLEAPTVGELAETIAKRAARGAA